MCHAMEGCPWGAGSPRFWGLFCPPPANELSSVAPDSKTMDPAPNVGPVPNCPAGSSLYSHSHRHGNITQQTHKQKQTETDTTTLHALPRYHPNTTKVPSILETLVENNVYALSKLKLSFIQSIKQLLAACDRARRRANCAHPSANRLVEMNSAA